MQKESQMDSNQSAQETSSSTGQQPQPQRVQRSQGSLRTKYALNTKLRGEATAPFRTVRLFGFGALMASAGLGLAINSIQLLAGISGAKGPSFDLGGALQSEAIDLGALVLLGFLLRNDLQAREKQLARLAREDNLAALPLRLSNNKSLQVGDLRGFHRLVIIAGPPAQVATSIAEADALREELERRSVFIVGLPTSDDTDGLVPLPQSKEDLRWRASVPLPGLDAWRSFISDQARLAGADVSESGCYISLRIDGRVRGSGRGMVPWDNMLVLPVNDGLFKGPLDFVDGKV